MPSTYQEPAVLWLIVGNVSEVRNLEAAFLLPAAAVLEGTVCRAIACSHHSLLSAFLLPTSVISIAWGLASHPAQHELLPC